MNQKNSMFFIISKLLVFVISPLVWIVFLLLFSLLSNYPDRKKRSLLWALVLTLFFSNPFLFDECSRLWEIPSTRSEEVKIYDAAIVLGGMSVYDEDLDRVQFFRGVDRLIQTVELYKQGKIKKIIFTGGSGSLLHPEMKEGNYIKRYLLYMGIPEADFFIESESKNTHENALFTKELLEKKNIRGNFLLITSAFHMRRSLGCFNKAGIEVLPYSTDRYSGPRKYEFDHLFIPEPSIIYSWNTLIHEMIGFIAYKIVGYS
ncbi:MAG: YdcF family protein [Bacteroidetes bacterium]|nr:YdcF family protein [Bacteroidota bacterium]